MTRAEPLQVFQSPSRGPALAPAEARCCREAGCGTRPSCWPGLRRSVLEFLLPAQQSRVWTISVHGA